MSSAGDERPPLSQVVLVRDVPDAELAVRGEVDIATSPDLDAVVVSVVERGAERLVLDLEAVTFIGSSGLASLLRAHRLVGAAGGRLVLRRPSRAVRDLLVMTRLLEHFTIDEAPG